VVSKEKSLDRCFSEGVVRPLRDMTVELKIAKNLGEKGRRECRKASYWTDVSENFNKLHCNFGTNPGGRHLRKRKRGRYLELRFYQGQGVLSFGLVGQKGDLQRMFPGR